MSDPRYAHQYEPRRKDGKCKTIIGDEHCGKDQLFLAHIRYEEKLVTAGPSTCSYCVNLGHPCPLHCER